MQDDPITWVQDTVAAIPLRRFVAFAGDVEIGAVEYDGGNRLWVWSSRLADDAWGWGASEDAAKRAFAAWLRGWLENFRPFFA